MPELLTKKPGVWMKTMRDMLYSQLEPTTPQDKILKYFIDNNDKRLDERHTKKMRELTGNSDLRIKKIAGMTQITWDHADPRMQGSLLVAYRVTCVSMDSAFLAEHNKGMLSALAARNKIRWDYINRYDSARGDANSTLNTIDGKIALLAKAQQYYTRLCKEFAHTLDESGVLKYAAEAIMDENGVHILETK